MGSLTYFDGIQFMGWGNIQHCDHLHDRVFPDYYGIQYSHAGPFSISRADEPFRIVQGPHLIITYPGVRIRYGVLPGQESRHHMYVCFRGKRVDDYIREGLLSVGADWSVVPVRHSAEFYQNLVGLQTALANQVSQSRCVHMLEGLLLQIQEQITLSRKPGRYAEDLDRLGQGLRKNPLRKWDFREEAEKMAVSYPHLRRIFQQHFSCAPSRYLLRSRLEYAASLLRDSNATIAQIAMMTGFSDVYHFSRQFKQFKHLAPARYRREFVTS